MQRYLGLMILVFILLLCIPFNDAVCEEGQFCVDSVCSNCAKCPVGSYQTNNSFSGISCTLCDSNCTTTSIGSMSSSACYYSLCPAGQYSPTCTADCVTCPVGQTSSAGSNTCFDAVSTHPTIVFPLRSLIPTRPITRVPAHVSNISSSLKQPIAHQEIHLFSAPVVPSYTMITIAGNGTSSSSGDGGPANLATMRFPTGIWENSLGEIFVCDSLDSTIKKISRSGIITIVAGISGEINLTGKSGAAASTPLDGCFAIIGDSTGQNMIIAGWERFVWYFYPDTFYLSRYAGIVPRLSVIVPRLIRLKASNYVRILSKHTIKVNKRTKVITIDSLKHHNEYFRMIMSFGYAFTPFFRFISLYVKKIF